ncbi:tRNA-specific 2-thiouridylase MnmA [Cellulomonas hominis]|uniref:tRNA-specific 2-thiouridylase MnmA n=1 Tax=Cellulomonas hominis TaxID=156981 RepID=A0A511FFH9_9CELL|nr:tRNA 2-thiouridine(34) synthase MnmA [Cellulomonas hominis]MBB5471699.1 tRNA-specific 2-thiouridylase [Cellulomonas hominis]GEL48005.1 tRNA-specific 2-thiouridylase MnmA [Cellulomonas hominis]
MRVLAALSGGVDSAVAAARAVDAGHDVVGVHMALSRSRAQLRTGSRGCCSIEDAGDARRAADVLGIPYYVWDLSERFEDTVVADFLAEYEAGRTPNPCVRCNEHIKFDALLDKALALGFDAVCTGHYARASAGADGAPVLRRAAERAKDQSYVLAVMGPGRLARAMFPLGDVESKDDVRAEAAARGLGVSAKPDSYDICFVADGDTRGFLRDRLGSRPGEVVDADGTVLGRHDGAYGFTVGQRKGLQLGRPAADGRPRYVLAIEPVSNRVVVGGAQDLAVGAIDASAAVWFGPAPREWTACTVQVRAHGAAVPARARATGDGGMEIRVDGGLQGVAAGQSAVLYGGPEGDRVLGQATVDRTHRPAGARA